MIDFLVLVFVLFFGGAGIIQMLKNGIIMSNTGMKKEKNRSMIMFKRKVKTR